jgi:hypothetical protein
VLVKYFKMSLTYHSFLVATYFGHHQATFTGETTALYTLSSVLLGTSLFLLLVSFVEYLHCIFFGSYFSLLCHLLCCVCFSAVFPYTTLVLTLMMFGANSNVSVVDISFSLVHHFLK